MDMGVDEPGGDNFAGHVILGFPGIVAHAHHQSAHHGDVPMAQLVGKDVYIGGVFQHHVGFFLAQGHADHALLFLHLAVDAFHPGFAFVQHTCSSLHFCARQDIFPIICAFAFPHKSVFSSPPWK